MSALASVGSAAHAPAELTWSNAQDALAPLVSAARAAAGLLDLTPLVRFDSAALAVLLEVRRQCGPATQLRGAAPSLRALARLYGVEPLLFAAPGTHGAAS